MALAGLLEARNTQRMLAALASAVLHLGLLVAAFMLGGRQDGLGASDQIAPHLVLIEVPDVDPTQGVDLPPIELAAIPAVVTQQPAVELAPPPLAGIELPSADLADADLSIPHEPEPLELTPPTPAYGPQPAATIVASLEERAALPRRLARLAEALQKTPQTPLEWEEDGKLYSATLVWERAKDGTALERVVAQVSASDHGKVLSTRIMLKRLAFSQFTQVVDRWDPMVQLHDDLIVGRFHSNSQFNVLHDARVGPKFLGKVSTAARSFEMHASGRRHQSDIFPGGVETRAGRIDLPEALQPFAWAPQDADIRIHELADDTRIRFFADGSYMWRTNGAPGAGYLNAPSEHPVYFIAKLGTTVFVQGVVAGKVLVYSPQRIVIEDDLTYAHDPRRQPDSGDYLGLVSDRYIEVAPPGVTGPGDLRVHAAIFAGRRFLIRDIDHPRAAALRIFGSLSAGSLSASEPRYSTEIEYDRRFERRRPPGFPLTSRYEAEDWNGHWLETSQPATSERIAEETF